MFLSGKRGKADSEISTARPELAAGLRAVGGLPLEGADKGAGGKTQDTRQSVYFPDPGRPGF